MGWTDTDFNRWEEKLDRLAEVVMKLAANERRIDILETTVVGLTEKLADKAEKLAEAQRKTQAELDKWKYFVFGGGAVVGFLVSLIPKLARSVGG